VHRTPKPCADAFEQRRRIIPDLVGFYFFFSAENVPD